MGEEKENSVDSGHCDGLLDPCSSGLKALPSQLQRVPLTDSPLPSAFRKCVSQGSPCPGYASFAGQIPSDNWKI